MANQAKYLDPALTNVANAWVNSQDNFIATKLFPEVLVTKPTFKIPEYGKENLSLVADTTRTGLAKAKSISYSRSYKDATPLVEHALSGEVIQEDYELTDEPFEPESDTVENVLERMALADEQTVANLVTNLSIVPGTTLLGGDKWSDYANSDVFDDVRAAVKSAGLVKFNSMALSLDSYLTLISHPQILDRLKWAQGGAVSMEQLKQLFGPYGITNIFIGQAQYNVNPEGTTASISQIWGGDVAFGYVTDRPARKAINGGYKFTLEGDMGTRKVTKDEKHNPNYTEIVVAETYNFQLLMPEAWYVYKGAF